MKKATQKTSLNRAEWRVLAAVERASVGRANRQEKERRRLNIPNLWVPTTFTDVIGDDVVLKTRTSGYVYAVLRALEKRKLVGIGRDYIPGDYMVYPERQNHYWLTPRGQRLLRTGDAH